MFCSQGAITLRHCVFSSERCASFGVSSLFSDSGLVQLEHRGLVIYVKIVHLMLLPKESHNRNQKPSETKLVLFSSDVCRGFGSEQFVGLKFVIRR